AALLMRSARPSPDSENAPSRQPSVMATPLPAEKPQSLLAVPMNRPIVLLDRQGKLMQELGHASPYCEFRRAPDARRHSRYLILENGTRDVWLLDPARQLISRFTFEGGFGAVWSPDARRIAYSEPATQGFYTKNSSGDGSKVLLSKYPASDLLPYPVDWSSD